MGSTIYIEPIIFCFILFFFKLARHRDKQGGREISNEVNSLMEKIAIDDRFKPATAEAPFNTTSEIINEKLITL